MIAELKTWLVGVIVTAGLPQKSVYVEAEELVRNNPLPNAVILVDAEDLARDGSRVSVATNQAGTVRTYRKRLYKRDVRVSVALKHRDEGQADQVLQGILRGIFHGWHDADGNCIRVVPGKPRWFDEKATLLKEAVVDLPLTFRGGVFADETVGLVREVAPEPDPAT